MEGLPYPSIRATSGAPRCPQSGGRRGRDGGVTLPQHSSHLGCPQVPPEWWEERAGWRGYLTPAFEPPRVPPGAPRVVGGEGGMEGLPYPNIRATSGAPRCPQSGGRRGRDGGVT